MMTLIALAILTAFIYSVYGSLRGGETLFWELTTLITIMLLGHYLEMRAVAGAQSALKELSKLLPDQAELLITPSESPSPDGEKKEGVSKFKTETRIVQLSQLKINSLVLVRPGGRIPADGVIIEGQSDVDESIVTGESRPMGKKPGQEVIAGTINGDGSLIVKVTKIGEQTFLAGVLRLVREAQTSKSKIQILADRAAFYLTIIAITAGIITFVSWLTVKGNPGFAIERLVAVLVIACPHALGLAIPLVASISTTLAARRGFLVRDRLALELARKVEVVVFDKTGTLTKGEYGVERIIPFDHHPERSEGSRSKRETAKPMALQNKTFVLQLAASVDVHSEHFVARALVSEAKKRKIELLPVKNFQRIPGKGVGGIVEGKEVLVGGEAILEMIHNSASPPLNKVRGSSPPQKSLDFWGTPGWVALQKGYTIIYVISQDQLIGAIALADQIREESHEAIAKLKNMGIKVVMLTGDSEEVAKWIAGELEIDDYRAKVLPHEKARVVKLYQTSPSFPFRISERNRSEVNRVAFVGDGVNDAPALAQADIGIAIGAGTNVAIESAGIILVKNDPRDIPRIIELSRLTYRKMLQNLFWATGYNVIALPLAAGVLATKGIFLEPALAAVLMSLSTVIVAVNALRLKLLELG